MTSRLAKWFVICSLVISIGGHWAILQSIAWVGMAIHYSHGTTVSQAISKALDGKHLCKLCKIVRDGKKAEANEEDKIDLEKVDFFTEPCTVFYFEAQPRPALSFSTVDLLRPEAPPTPPPLAA